MDILRNFIAYANGSTLRERERDIFPAEASANAKGNSGDKIHLRIQKPVNAKVFEDKIRVILSSVSIYEPQTFPVKRPEFEDIEKVVIAEARKKIRSLKFWTLPRRRDDYVGENTFPRYKEAVGKWEIDKADFEIAENKRVAELNKSEQERAGIESKAIEDDLKAFMSPSIENIRDKIKSTLKSVQSPYGLSIAYAWSENTVYLDVLYPERDIMLKCEYHTTPRTITEGNFRYINILLGSSYVLASHIFNIGETVRNVVVTGHSQILGTKIEETLYAVNFDREKFQTEFRTIKKFSPIDSFFKYQYLFDATPARGNIHPIRIRLENGLFENRFEHMEFEFLAIRPTI
ncbi:MAG TPA: hypothetical protein DDX40_10210 [Rikenellaceae bacterium]|nr:hypothetical protein [Rikenellaceae bacterium]